MRVTIDAAERPAAADLQVVEQGLIEHAAAAGIAPRQHRPLTILLRADDGAVVGGLVGTTVWGWLQVAQLWIDEALRGQGHGRALLRAAEAEAARRGCRHALLDTFDFQARGFYERLGYRVFGEVQDFPHGHTRYFLQKTFAVAPAAADPPTGGGG